MSTVFSQLPESAKIYQGEHFFLIRDGYAVSPGHTLIISNKEKVDYFELSDVERKNLDEMILKAKELVELEFEPDGYNIGMNCGEYAGQTVMHFHCHLIPRYKGDMDNPRGGVRHCVAGKGYY
ncbi:HIT family protein [Flammeovirga pacifica]|uniref:Diadenosine tetraphosphate hydrolase n=1 Tax=Flammeovirga pacifica TaxID=915059 RepID=A0A1S1YW60_FLAPC|nr:HIT family protein [Flammeovirga pacifica]OHX65113.1 diadenosine tetraphosphate hydrolase [Flammeovirga pacifica]